MFRAAQRRQQAEEIWRAGVAAVQPQRCLEDALQNLDEPLESLARYDRILVVGGGKAGAAMAQALETLFERHRVPLARVSGLVNVPSETAAPLEAIRLHPARPMGINYPTPEAAAGAAEMLGIAASAGPNDLLICLISGGGSALLPAPVAGITLAQKQEVTRLLHGCGATIQEMNAVRKHLSRIKGGGLVRHFTGARICSLIISDVIGDPLDVIASGPTAVDPSTFADALAVLQKYDLEARTPRGILAHLGRGVAGQVAETLKEMPQDAAGQPRVQNVIIANNQRALLAAQQRARALGYEATNLGSEQAGDTEQLAQHMTALVRRQPRGGNLCLLMGGETTVVLPPGHGLGGRNQEFVLAFLNSMGLEGMKGVTVLCGGTDGEDGPTDAAGAIGDQLLLQESQTRRLDPAHYLARHDAYHFFEPLGGLLKTGPTHTNVMDLRVILAYLV